MKYTQTKSSGHPPFELDCINFSNTNNMMAYRSVFEYVRQHAASNNSTCEFTQT